MSVSIFATQLSNWRNIIEGCSLEVLAKRADITIETLSRMENADPSVPICEWVHAWEVMGVLEGVTQVTSQEAAVLRITGDKLMEEIKESS